MHLTHHHHQVGIPIPRRWERGRLKTPVGLEPETFWFIAQSVYPFAYGILYDVKRIFIIIFKKNLGILQFKYFDIV